MASNVDTGRDRSKSQGSVTFLDTQNNQEADDIEVEDVDPDNEASLPMMPRTAQAPGRPYTQQRPGFAGYTGANPDQRGNSQQPQYTGRGIEQFSTTDMKAEPAEQPAPTGMIAWVGFGCCVFALMCLSISFASPYWLQCWPNSFNTFRNLGLWEVCFQDYMHHKDDSQEIYNGCWWVFNREKRYWKLREWLTPPWFISCQVMVTGTLMVEVGTAIIAAMIFLHCCPIMNHEYLQTYGMFAASSMMFLASLITLITAIIFGTECQDRNWMPRPDLNFLSWGFGFYIISGIMSLAAGVAFFYQAWKVYQELLHREMEFTRAAMEMSGYPMANMSQSGYADTYGQQSYGRPSIGSQASYEPSYGKQPSYGGQSYDGKQSYATQPSFDGKQSLGTQPSYSDKDYYDQGQGGYDQGGYGRDQGGYARDPYAPKA